MWLDRQRPGEALRELEAIERSGGRDGDRSDVQVLRALALGALNRPADAIRSWRRAVASDSGNAAAFYLLVQYQMRVARPEDVADARRGLERAVQRRRVTREGDGAFAPFQRIDLLRQASGVAPIFPYARYASAFDALRGGDYGAAVAKLRAAVAGDPMVRTAPATRAVIARAASLVKQDAVDAAIEQLRPVADASPDAEVHRLLGLLYSLTGEQGRSIERLRRAMALEPADERALVRLVDVLVSERRFAEAGRELTASPVRSGPIAYRRAQLYQRQSLLNEAAKAMQESESFGPVIGRDYFYQSWGSLLVNQADFDGAISAYARRIEVNPNSAEAHRQIAEIDILQGRHDEALTELAVATWLDPRDAKAHAAAGQVYARLSKYPEAIDALTRALSLDGSLREARYALGTVLIRVGRGDEGRAALETFGRQQAEAEAQGRREFELDALRRQAAKQSLAGEGAQSIAVLQQVLTLDPGSSRSHRDLGVALLRSRQTADAIPHLERAQQLEETADGFALLAEAYAAAGNADAAARMRTAYVESKRRAQAEQIRELMR
jgi:tetratricopeptide (TPR) repeat protein